MPGGGGGKRDKKLCSLFLLAPTPSQSVGCPLRRPAFQGREKKGRTRREESADSPQGIRVQPNARRERRGPRGCAPGPRPPGYPWLFRSGPGGPGLLPSLPWHVSGGGGSRSGPLGPGNYSCPLSECLGQPRGPLGHPQPAPGGSGSTLLPEPPARQGALNRGSRWARQQPPVPWDLGQVPFSSWAPVSRSGDGVKSKLSALSDLVVL